ncbi:MAG: response regulator transcription factor [Chloroflexota bacterium]
MSAHTNQPKSVLIVDDHPLMRSAMVQALILDEGFVIAGESADGLSAVAAARTLHPDVIIMDINLPIMNGVEAIRNIITENPCARILAITSSVDENIMRAAFQAGALGYLLKEVMGDQFLISLHKVANGEQYLPPRMLSR